MDKCVMFQVAIKDSEGRYESAGPFYCEADEVVGLCAERNRWHTFRQPQEVTRIYLRNGESVMVNAECSRVKAELDRAIRQPDAGGKDEE